MRRRVRARFDWGGVRTACEDAEDRAEGFEREEAFAVGQDGRAWLAGGSGLLVGPLDAVLERLGAHVGGGERVGPSSVSCGAQLVDGGRVCLGEAREGDVQHLVLRRAIADRQQVERDDPLLACAEELAFVLEVLTEDNRVARDRGPDDLVRLAELVDDGRAAPGPDGRLGGRDAHEHRVLLNDVALHAEEVLVALEEAPRLVRDLSHVAAHEREADSLQGAQNGVHRSQSHGAHRTGRWSEEWRHTLLV